MHRKIVLLIVHLLSGEYIFWKTNLNMSWLTSVIRKRAKRKREERPILPGWEHERPLFSTWKTSPGTDKTSHSKWWDISKSHNRWIRVAVQSYENSSKHIDLRLLKPEFESGHWHRRNHSSVTIEKLTGLTTLLGFSDKATTVAAGMWNNYLQEFNLAIEAALNNGVNGNLESNETTGKKQWENPLRTFSSKTTALNPFI